MRSKQRHEGYLLIENRYGEAVSEEAIRASGKEVIAPKGNVFEAATITCSHCHQIFLKNPDRVRARGYCAKCDHYICDNPGCNVECLPMNKVLDDLQEEMFLQEQRSGIILTP